VFTGDLTNGPVAKKWRTGQRPNTQKTAAFFTPFSQISTAATQGKLPQSTPHAARCGRGSPSLGPA
jgi:hypothetical protein